MTEETNPIMVSISCITYNHEPYIAQCLEGFVMQKTNFKFEAVVHDDASTDKTAEIIREYAAKYPDIIKPIYETENQYSKNDGSLNKIMNEACTGKYIAMCEGDDYWMDPLKLQKQVDFLESHEEYSGCFHNVDIVTTIKDIDKEKYALMYLNNQTTFTIDDYILQGNKSHTCSVVYRNMGENILQKIQPFTADYFLHLVNLTHGKYYRFQDVMASYRIHDGGVFSLKNTMSFLQKKNMYKKQTIAYKYLLDNNILKNVSDLSMLKIKQLFLSNCNAYRINSLCLGQCKEAKHATCLMLKKSLPCKLKHFTSLLLSLIIPAIYGQYLKNKSK